MQKSIVYIFLQVSYTTISHLECMSQTTTTKLVLAGMIAVLSIAVYASVSTQAAFADSRCGGNQHSGGSGNPHSPSSGGGSGSGTTGNPHDFSGQQNPHDACVGS